MSQRTWVVSWAICSCFAAWGCGGSDAEPQSHDDGGAVTAHPSDAGNAVHDAGTSGMRADAGEEAPPPAAQDAGSDAGHADVDASAGDASVSGIDPSELEMLRQVCVDTINMYRATLMLPALTRATPDRELCSDEGAQKDGVSMTAHSSAGSNNPCVTAQNRKFPGFNAQDTCPGWPVGKRGSATIADALKKCLMSMWAEGVPTEGVQQCIDEYRAGNTACFEAHGHYINMSSSTAKGVSCGFFDMGNSTYWMNQDFL